jgi:hypothetical protein
VAKAPLLNQGPWVFESGVEPGTPFTDGVPKPAPDPVASFSGQKVAVVKDGKAFDVPVEQLSQAESEGYHVESDAERAGREYVKENPYLGAAAAGIQKVVSGVTFGAGDAVLDRVVDPYKLARFRAIQANSPTATAVGEGLGFVGSLAVPLPKVSKYLGLEAKAAEGVAAHAAAKEGSAAAAAFPAAIAGDAEAALAQGLPYARAGAASGAERLPQFGIEFGGRAPNPGLAFDFEHAFASKLAPELAAHAAPGLEAQTAAHAPSLAKKLIESGVDAAGFGGIVTAPQAFIEAVSGDPEQAAETVAWGIGTGIMLGIAGPLIAKGAESAWGAAKGLAPKVSVRSIGSQSSINAAAKEATYHGGLPELGKLMQEHREVLQGITEPHQKWGERLATIGDEWGGATSTFYKTADEAGAHFDAKAFVRTAEKEIVSTLDKPGFEGIKGDVQKYLESFTSHAGESGKVSFSKAWEWRQGLDDLVYRTIKSGSIVTDELRGIRRVLQRELEAQGGAVLGEKAVADLRATNRKYGLLQALREGVEQETLVREKNRFFSLNDTIGGVGIGAAHGGPAGVAVGVVGGLAQKLVRERGNTIAARLLGGGGFASIEKAYAAAGERLDQLPLALEGRLVVKGANPASAVLAQVARDMDSHFDIWGHSAYDAEVKRSGDPLQQTFTKVADRIVALATDQVKLQEKVADIVAPFGESPEVQTALAMHYARAMQYLAAKLPKSPGVPNPLVKDRWKPSGADIYEWAARYSVVSDPWSVIDRLNDDTLVRAHVEAGDATHPATMRAVRKSFLEFASSDRAKPLPYQKMMKIGFLLGMPMHPSVKQTVSYQGVYMPEDQQPQKATKIKGPTMMSESLRISTGG